MRVKTIPMSRVIHWNGISSRFWCTDYLLELGFQCIDTVLDLPDFKASICSKVETHCQPGPELGFLVVCFAAVKFCFCCLWPSRFNQNFKRWCGPCRTIWFCWAWRRLAWCIMSFQFLRGRWFRSSWLWKSSLSLWRSSMTIFRCFWYRHNSSYCSLHHLIWYHQTWCTQRNL